MRRALGILVTLVLVALLFRLFPPFHIVPLKQAQDAKAQAAFNPGDYAAAFWTNQLLKSFDRASDASVVIAALRQDPKTAARRYGWSVGLGSSAFYFLRGTGTVVTVGSTGVNVSLGGSSTTVTVLLQTGPIFGNAVRDATGLLDASAFPNSQDFNNLSAELNRIVETQVIPSLKTNAASDRKLRFAGCAEIEEDTDSVVPLKVVPIKVEFE